VAAHSAAGRECARKAVLHQVEPRLCDSGDRGEPLDRGVQARRFPDGQLTSAGKPHGYPVAIPVERRRQEYAAEDEDRKKAIAAEHPAEEPEHGAGADEQRPRL
jgi:hypothetical protein